MENLQIIVEKRFLKNWYTLGHLNNLRKSRDL